MRSDSLRQLVRFSSLARRLLLIGIDALLLPLAVWLSFWLRLSHPLYPSFQASGLWLLPAVLLVGLPLVALTEQVKGLTRYVGSRALYRLAGRNGLLVLLLAGLGVMLRLPMPPRSERRRIVSALQRQAIPVLQIPTVDDLTSGRARIDALRPVAIEDLLGGAWGDLLPTRLSGRGCGGCGG